MALGLGLLFGVRLPGNFFRPYSATSLADFWRRWHITFSFWLRDYLYIPLGGSREGIVRQIRNVFITMILGGLWHGAHWTFVAWGALHGLFLAGKPAAPAPRAAAGCVRRDWVLMSGDVSRGGAACGCCSAPPTCSTACHRAASGCLGGASFEGAAAFIARRTFLRAC